MKSDISLLSTLTNNRDIIKQMLEIEVGVTEEILGLREDKLTLMQEYNRAVEDRLRMEREMNRIKKVSERSS